MSSLHIFKKDILKKLRQRQQTVRRVEPVRVMVLGFAAVILIGALLLMLPISTRSGEGADFITALFTATSATCVTGLVVEDTYLFWSPFGCTVIILLIQTGGLGFMTMAAAFSLLLRRRISMRERLLMGTSLNMDSLSGMVRLVRRVIFGTFLFEGMGALILSVRFMRDYGFLGGIARGVFHSISSFCNAGFDLFGDRMEFGSLIPYAGDFVITITVCLLIVLGGLGFFVWSDIYSARDNGRLHTQTKIVLRVTLLLIALGTVVFFIAEYNNPATIGNENVFHKFLSSLFQSVTTRTAGYAQMDQASMTGVSKALSVALMFIGGSPGSTAGGVKTVTMAVLLMTAFQALRGNYQTTVNGKSISYKLVVDALSVFVFGIFFVSMGTFMVAAFDSVSLSEALYECTSAFGTVGLTLGITPSLSVPSQLVLIGLMFLGRVGIITIGMATMMRGRKEAKIKYPEARVMIG